MAMHITFFGAGYVGLVQATVLAEVGALVVCVDNDSAKVSLLNRGEIPFYEPGLERLVQENTAAGRLTFTSDPEEGVLHGQVQFIAVGTPSDQNGAADLSHVLGVADEIASLMNDHKLVVLKSTVPVGTSDMVRVEIAQELKRRGRSDLTFDVAANPEFLKQGSAVSDCMRPDRIVIGVASDETERVLREIYAPFDRSHDKMVVMEIRSAELTKYAANCLLATKISFMNEMASLADALGADIEMVRQGIGSDPRIGYHFLYPGVGYGGSCLPKDLRAMIRVAEGIQFDAVLLKSTERRNSEQKRFLVEKILSHFGGDIVGRTFAVWGLAFKPHTDDMREAPARAMLEALWHAGAGVRAYDPKAMGECARLYGKRPELVLCDTQEEALEGADALIVITEWENFRAPDFVAMRTALKEPVIFDGRNLYDPEIARRYGMTVYGVGRRT
jgi:UDPglucose 6-dehydrogenase